MPRCITSKVSRHPQYCLRFDGNASSAGWYQKGGLPAESAIGGSELAGPIGIGAGTGVSRDWTAGSAWTGPSAFEVMWTGAVWIGDCTMGACMYSTGIPWPCIPWIGIPFIGIPFPGMP